MRKLNFFSILFLVFLTSVSHAQQGKNGAEIVTGANTIINEATALTTNASAGNISIKVSNSALNTHSRFSQSLAQGDLIMIIQMQGATINGTSNDSTWGAVTNYNNCGLYEFAQVAGVPDMATINLSARLNNNYTAAGKVQVVRIPRYITLTVNNGGVLTGDAWNGATGGIIVAEVQNNTVINSGGSILATGLGFRGGLVQDASSIPSIDFASQNSGLGAAKGEGIAGYETDYNAFGGMFGRGAPANGGGGGDEWNASGGGGANGGDINAYTGNGNPDITTDTAWIAAWNLEYPGFAYSTSSGGGRGGYTIEWGPSGVPSPYVYPPGNVVYGDTNHVNNDLRNRENAGGKGGRPLDYSTGRIFEGGGGGAGHEDQSVGGSGGIGGGIVYLLSYGTVTGAGSIISNGQNGGDDNSANNLGDGSGGAGGGGTVIIYSTDTIRGISITANGGRGGNQYISYTFEVEGPGGGGGGGYIGTTPDTSGVSTTANGGVNGVTDGYLMTLFPPNGATKGYIGTPNAIITCLPSLSVVANVSPNVTICPGANTNLSASGGSSYLWSPSTNLSCDTCSDPVANPPLTTTYHVTVSSGQCSSSTDSVVITVANIANAGVISAVNNPVCPGFATSLLISGSSGRLQWQSSNSGNSFANIPGADSAAYFIQPGQTTYFRVLADSSTCADTSASYTLVVNPAPVNPTLSTNDSIVCSPASAVITASGPYSAYLWNDGDTTDFTRVTITGRYSVSVTDANGCTASSGQQGITIFAALPPPGISTNDSLICASDSTPIHVLGTYSSYAWNDGDTRSYTYANEAGNYRVTVTDANGCSAVSRNLGINVYPVPSVSTIVQGNILASFNAVSYQWFCNDTMIPGATSSIYTVERSGNYAVQVTDTNGCKTLSNYTYVVINGISKISENDLLDIYPNPFTGTIFVNAKKADMQMKRAEILDVLGRICLNQEFENTPVSSFTLNLSALSQGIYFIKVVANEKDLVRPIIKQ